MHKLQLTGRNLGPVFNSRNGSLYATHSCCYWSKRPDLELKTQPKQLLGYLPLDIVLNLFSINYGKSDWISIDGIKMTESLMDFTFGIDSDIFIPSWVLVAVLIYIIIGAKNRCFGAKLSSRVQIACVGFCLKNPC